MRDEVCAPDNCTLCMACANICPQNAISLGLDEIGFEKISIDHSRCIECNLCELVCSRRNEVKRRVADECYAGQAKNRQRLRLSASGGAFQMLAEVVLQEGGIVYGAEMIHSCEFEVRHVRISRRMDLDKILNSKYVLSHIEMIYRDVKHDLSEGRLVLFSGTPCQVQGLYSYLNCDHENLLTSDIICHGVSSTKIFNDYINELEQRDNIKIVNYIFRDKSISWGTNYSYTFIRTSDNKAKKHTRHYPKENSSYMMNYLNNDIFRKNCYSCSLCKTSRVADFTFGDYWEIEIEHPNYILKAKPRLSLRGGVNCILVNSEKAKRYIPQLKNEMILYPTELKRIANHNKNLIAPSPKGNGIDNFIQLYLEGGYGKIEDVYFNKIKKHIRLYKLRNIFKSFLPDWIRVLIYNSRLLRKLIFH